MFEDSDFEAEGFEGDWEDDDLASDPPAPAWRRPVLIGVSVIIIVALVWVPVYNALTGPTTADNGLEVCGFDYCIVEEAVRQAGLELEMSRLYNDIIDDEGVVVLARELTEYLGVDGVSVGVVDELEGRLGGVYDPENRVILIERPARAWTVLHEVAHVVEGGHGEDFQEVLTELTTSVATD